MLHVQLGDGAQRTPGSRECVLRHPLAEASPAGGVRAAKEAMPQALRELAGSVLATTR